MKKTFLTIIIAVLLFTVLTVSVSAVTTATTEAKSCAKGDTVTLTVSVTSTSNVTSGAVEVTYDSSKLQIVEGTWNTPGAPLVNFDKSNGKGAFAFSTASTVNEKIFSIKFEVLDNAPLGDTPVDCKIILRNGTTNLSVTNKAGKVTVTCKHSFTKKTTDHLASEANCLSGAKYYYTCSICGEKGEATFVQGDPTSHNYNKKVETSDYLVKAVKCVNTAEYYYSCECGKKGTEKFTGDASWSHNYEEKLRIDDKGHWYGCTSCGEKKSYSDHTLKSGICLTCNFVSTKASPEHVHAYVSSWISNSMGHWHECSCGEKKDFAAHTVENGSCTSCGFVIPVEQHTHEFSQEWNNNAGGHWHLCACGEKGDLDAHTYGEWTVNGTERSRVCSVCGFTDKETVTSNDDPGNNEPGNDDNVNQPEKKSNELLVGILCTVGTAVLVVGTELIIYFIKKKSKVSPPLKEEISEKTE